MSGFQGPNLWPSLVILFLTTSLGVYSWRRRGVQGARPFAIACLFGGLWIVGVLGEILTGGFAGKVLWIKFQVAWQLPTATAISCFVLAYAGLERWLTRRNLILLALPSVLALAAILSNDFHHLQWTAFRMGEEVVPSLGALGWTLIAYTYLLGIVNLLVLVWLAVRFPLHRWPVAIILLGQLIGRSFYIMDKIQPDTLDRILGPGGSTALVIGVVASAYALALFRFHVLDPIPLAQAAVIEQMHEGMLVLDSQGRIVDLNPTASHILAESAAGLRSRPAAGVLSVKTELLIHGDQVQAAYPEISLGTGKDLRHYRLNTTPLTDRRKRIVGHLVLLHDITGQKREQERKLEQQRVMATLEERERLARELHDGIGQVLGYVSMQAQAAGKWVRDGHSEKARSLLDRLAGVARDAHTDVRDSILSLRASKPQEWSFVPALNQYLDAFQANYGIHIGLTLGEGIKESCFSPAAGVQILRVIQEALTNARKHGGAGTVQISMERATSQANITISDDGCGFDASGLEAKTDGHFGQIFMRERIAQIGGSLDIDSMPGTGTVVRISLPLGNPVEEFHESVAR